MSNVAAGPAPASDRPAPVLRLVEGLRSLDRAYSRGHHGRWSARRRAQLVDECLVRLFRSSGVPDGVALAAVGGYGRGELAPASDIDLLLVHELRDGRVVRELAERLLYPLWDAGFDVGHGVRTVKESMALAAERFDVATAMLDARLLDGDAALFHSMRERLWEWSRKPRTAWVDRLRAAADVRRARFGSASQRLEPDVKEGSGGLRDINTLGWLAPAVVGDGGIRGLESAGFLRTAEREALEAAQEYLVRVRSALHLEAGKKVDVLRQDLQPQLASDLGFSDEPGLPAPDGLMRAVFEHARDVEHIGAQVFDRVARGAASAAAVPGVSGTPEAVIAAFAQAASRGDSVPPADLDMVDAAKLPEVVEWTPRVRDAFLEILRAGEPGVGALEALDRAELLERFLPAWGAVRCRPQRDPYHRFPVDVHLLEALAEVSRLLRGQAPADDPVASRAAAAVGDSVDGLLLGALLHDIGKTGHGGHLAAGSTIAGRALDAMGLPEETRDLAQFLVANHLLLPDTATRRDLQDEDLVLSVAAQIETEERLAALYLLTVADASATGPHAWTPWRATLVRELVAKIQHALERGEMGHEAAVRLGERAEAIRAAVRGQPIGEIERFLVRMPRNYLLSVPEVEGGFHGDVDEDRWRKFRSTLRKSVEGRLSLEYRVAEKRGYYPAPRAGIPTKVTVDNRASDFFTIIEVATADRIGLLFDITRTLTDLQLDVHIAKVATYGDRVIDAFYVRDVVGRKIEDADHEREIVTALRARMAD